MVVSEAKSPVATPRLSSMLRAPTWRIGAETPRDGMSRAARKIRLVGMTERPGPRFVKLWTASNTSALGSGVTSAKQTNAGGIRGDGLRMCPMVGQAVSG